MNDAIGKLAERLGALRKFYSVSQEFFEHSSDQFVSITHENDHGAEITIDNAGRYICEFMAPSSECWVVIFYSFDDLVQGLKQQAELPTYAPYSPFILPLR